MKVFISWSGEVSHQVAQALKDWLPQVIQIIDPFLSSSDIESGVLWFDSIGSELDQTDFGIICLTPQNLDSPWIHFEAGALSKRIGKAHVVPMLFSLTPASLSGPLANFNAVLSSKEELRKLINTLNAKLGENGLPEIRLSRAFDRCWDELEVQLQTIRASLENSTDAEDAPPTPQVPDMVEEILSLVRGIANRQVTDANSTVVGHVRNRLLGFARGDAPSPVSLANISSVLEYHEAQRLAHRLAGALSPNNSSELMAQTETPLAMRAAAPSFEPIPPTPQPSPAGRRRPATRRRPRL